MQINKAKIKDLDVLTDLIIKFKEELTKFFPEDLQIFRKKKSVRRIELPIRKEINNKRGLFLIAESNKEVIGFAYGTIKEHKHMVFKSLKYGKLQHIWVKKEFRNQKIASELKNKLFDWFKDKGCCYVELLVLNKNPALQIYKKWGFEPILKKLRKKLN